MKFVTREKLFKLLWLQALLRRLYEGDPELSYYTEQFRRLYAGFAGEQRVDREWYEIICPDTFLVLHNLALENTAKHFHQVDTLFICRYFMLVVEIKNISGRLDFDGATYQCTRTKSDGTVEGFPNAITQIQRHIQFFKTIFKIILSPLKVPSFFLIRPRLLPIIQILFLFFMFLDCRVISNIFSQSIKNLLYQMGN